MGRPQALALLQRMPNAEMNAEGGELVQPLGTRVYAFASTGGAAAASGFVTSSSFLGNVAIRNPVASSPGLRFDLAGGAVVLENATDLDGDPRRAPWDIGADPH